jgi:hypothetical protein
MRANGAAAISCAPQGAANNKILASVLLTFL